MKHALFVALALLAATAASALNPATETYLKEQGYDPKSDQIASIADDVVTAKDGTVYSLDTLAADRDKIGMKAFITTRNFVKKYMADTKTPFPSDRKQYQTVFLRADEVSFILASLKKPFSLA